MYRPHHPLPTPDRTFEAGEAFQIGHVDVDLRLSVGCVRGRVEVEGLDLRRGVEHHSFGAGDLEEEIVAKVIVERGGDTCGGSTAAVVGEGVQRWW
jgi:hypothetical protein